MKNAEDQKSDTFGNRPHAMGENFAKTQVKGKRLGSLSFPLKSQMAAF